MSRWGVAALGVALVAVLAVPAAADSPRTLVARDGAIVFQVNDADTPVDAVEPNGTRRSRMLRRGYLHPSPNGKYGVAIDVRYRGVVQRLSDGRTLAVLSGDSGLPNGLESAAWSPDGRSLVFERYVGRAYEVVVLNIATGGRRVLAKAARIHSPSWTRDGRGVVFIRSAFPADAGGAVLTDVRSLRRHVLARGVSAVAASPDGRRVAMLQGRSLLITDSSGRHARAARLPPLSGGGSLAWSPKARELVVWPMNGGGAMRVTAATLRTVRILGGRVDDVAWSPTGRRIAFSRDGAIWVAAADGRGARRVAVDYATDLRFPRWDPLGRSIARLASRRLAAPNPAHVRQATRTVPCRASGPPVAIAAGEAGVAFTAADGCALSWPAATEPFRPLAAVRLADPDPGERVTDIALFGPRLAWKIFEEHNYDYTYVRVADLAGGPSTEIAEATDEGQGDDVSIARSGRVLVFSSCCPSAIARVDGTRAAWRRPMAVRVLDVAADDVLVASVGADAIVRLTDASTGRAAGSFRAPGAAGVAVADGAVVVARRRSIDVYHRTGEREASWCIPRPLGDEEFLGAAGRLAAYRWGETFHVVALDNGRTVALNVSVPGPAALGAIGLAYASRPEASPRVSIVGLEELQNAVRHSNARLAHCAR